MDGTNSKRTVIQNIILNSSEAFGRVVKIPEIGETGSTGAQEEASTSLTLPDQESHFEPMPMTNIVHGLAATNARSLGGEVAAQLLAGSFAQIANELKDTKASLRAERNELDTLRTDLSTTRTRKAVLRERVSALTHVRYVGNFLITIGLALIGVSIELSRNDSEGLSYVLGGLSLVMVIVGWSLPVSGRKK